MGNTNGIAIFGWTILLSGALLLFWQTAKGGGSDFLFNLGVILMISGSVLRLFANFRRSDRKQAVRQKPPSEPPAH